jgi:ribosomal protein L44E
VHHGSAEGTFVSDLIEAAKVEVGATCKECGSHRIYRVFRKGFLQTQVYPMFGYYPWKCKQCKAHSMLKLRKFSSSSAKELAGSKV